MIRNCIISHCRSDFWITFIANETFQKLIKTDNECSTSWMLINLKDSFISIKGKYFNYFDEMRKSLADLISIQINLLRHVVSTKERDWINLNPTRWLWLTWVYSLCRFESGSPRTTFKISSGINFRQEENLEKIHSRSWKVGKSFPFLWYKLALSLYRVNKRFIWKFSSALKHQQVVYVL